MNLDKHLSDLWHERNKYLRLLMVRRHIVSRRRFFFYAVVQKGRFYISFPHNFLFSIIVPFSAFMLKTNLRWLHKRRKKSSRFRRKQVSDKDVKTNSYFRLWAGLFLFNRLLLKIHFYVKNLCGVRKLVSDIFFQFSECLKFSFISLKLGFGQAGSRF